MKKRFLLIIICFCYLRGSDLLAVSNPRLHTDNQNAWLMYFGTFRISNRFGIHAEAQLRRTNWITSPQQLLLRTGINYHLKDNLYFTAGYCFAQTSPYGEFAAKSAFPENRLWEQLQIKTYQSRVEWISRLRLEQRFSKLPVPDPDFITYEPGNSVYTNRIRIMNRFSIPLKGKEIKNKIVFVSFYDELFINFGKNVGLNYVDQNRAYIALGYQVPKLGRLEIGFMEQTVVKSDGMKIEDNHTLQVSLSTNIDFRKNREK